MKKMFIVFLLVALVKMNAMVDFNGFISTSASYSGKKIYLQNGAFELDLESQLSKNISFAGALVLKNEDIGLCATFYNFQLHDNLNLQIGLLDLPF